MPATSRLFGLIGFETLCLQPLPPTESWKLFTDGISMCVRFAIHTLNDDAAYEAERLQSAQEKKQEV